MTWIVLPESQIGGQNEDIYVLVFFQPQLDSISGSMLIVGSGTPEISPTLMSLAKKTVIIHFIYGMPACGSLVIVHSISVRYLLSPWQTHISPASSNM